ETVADHPFSGLKRRRNCAAHVVVARGCKKNCLRFRAERLGPTRQQDVTDDLGTRRATRLARQHDADAQRCEPFGQLPCVGGFSAALAAFECDEAPAHEILGLRARRGAAPIVTGRHIRSTPARNRLITSSVTESNARCVTLPLPIASDVLSGTSSTRVSLRHTFNLPTFRPFCTGAGNGPV